ncbi:MAG TPA: YihY/virulence factor BrkB family protein [Candidatus Baltobacteraceae bacterium]|jgi:membrane protein
MLRRLALLAIAIALATFREWRVHRSGEMAGALSFFASIALGALLLVALYVAGTIAVPDQLRDQTLVNVGHFTGSQNGHALTALLQAAKGASWIPLVAGTVLFTIAVLATAMQLQAALNFIWDVHDPKEDRAARSVGKSFPTFLLMFALSLVLLIILLVGAGLHALTVFTHALPLVVALSLQVVNVAGSIVVLTLLFVAMFARLPPTKIPRPTLWIGSLVTAIMYERAQFFLALYLGSIDVRSLYAIVGIVLAVLLWLYYSAQVVLVGANFTKVLAERAES